MRGRKGKERHKGMPGGQTAAGCQSWKGTGGPEDARLQNAGVDANSRLQPACVLKEKREMWIIS